MICVCNVLQESVLLRQMSRTARMYLAATRASKLQKLNKDWPDAAGLVADSYDLYDIASGEGIRFEESKQLAEREPGEDVNINAPVENAEMMWKPSSPGLGLLLKCHCSYAV